MAHVTPNRGWSTPDEYADPYWAAFTAFADEIDADVQALFDSGHVIYQGTWNADTNTPSLTSSVGTKGHYYVVSTSGDTDLDGEDDWVAGDWAIFNGATWQKVDNTQSSTSMDIAYDNFGSNPATIVVDNAEGQGDVKWDLTGALSFDIDLANTTGSIDGFRVYDGASTEYWRLLRKNDNAIDLEAALQNATYGLSGNMDVDATGFIHLDAGAASHFTVAGADLTVSATGGGELFLSSADNVEIQSLDVADISASNSISLRSGGTASAVTGVYSNATGTGDTALTTLWASSLGSASASDYATVQIYSTIITGSAKSYLWLGSQGGSYDTQETYLYGANLLNVSCNAGNVNIGTVTAGDVNISSADDIGISAVDFLSIDVPDIEMTPSSSYYLECTGDFTLYGEAGSNVTVADANLTVETSSSGNLILQAAGNQTFNDQYLSAAIPLSETGVTGLSGYTATSIVGALNEAKAGTLDEAYDGGGSGAGRTITADSGAIAITTPDTSNNAVLSLTQNDITNNPTALEITNAGTGAAITLAGAGARTISSTSANLLLETVTAGDVNISSADDVDITTVDMLTVDAADIEMVTGSYYLECGGADFTLYAEASSNVTVDASNLTLETTTSGNIIIDAKNSVQIDSESDSYFKTTYASGAALEMGITETGGVSQLAFKTSGSSANYHSITFFAENPGAGDAGVWMDGDHTIGIGSHPTYTLDASIQIGTASASSARTITIGEADTSNRGSIHVVNGVSMDVNIEGTWEVDTQEASHIKMTAESATDETLLLESTNSGAGQAFLELTAEDVLRLGKTSTPTVNLNGTSAISLTADTSTTDQAVTTELSATATGTKSAGTPTADLDIYAESTNDNATLDIWANAGGTGTINIGAAAYATTLNLGTGAAAHTVTLGSLNTTSTTTIQSGTGGTQIATATSQKIGLWGATPIVQPSAYTQTYSTADKTIGAYTPDDESGAFTGIDNAQGGTPYAQLTDLNALRVAYENLRGLSEDIAQALNAVIDDLQAMGAVG